MIWYLIAVAALLPWIQLMINGRLGLKRVPKMENLEVPTTDELEKIGRLSIVIAARNEERNLEKAIRSLAAQDHPDFELIVVNDRSTDSTGRILDGLAREFPERIKAVHVTDLPEGWLGKCNALHQGGEAATGDYILFADADVEFEQGVLLRSHAYARREDADQFTAFPETVADSFFEHAMLNVFALCFMLGFPPHRAMVRNSGKYVGVGAFNMVKTQMYRRIQGHRFLRLQVVDDVGLGKLIKFSGGNVRLAWGMGQIRVRWQEDLAATIKGLEKNFFASTNYSVVKTTAMSVGVVIMFLWPWIGVWVGPAGSRIVAAVALGLQVLTAAVAAVRAGFSPVHGATAQAGAVLLLIAMLRSMIVTLKRGGITWRDSFYPINDLKQFKL